MTETASSVNPTALVNLEGGGSIGEWAEKDSPHSPPPEKTSADNHLTVDDVLTEFRKEGSPPAQAVGVYIRNTLRTPERVKTLVQAVLGSRGMGTAAWSLYAEVVQTAARIIEGEDDGDDADGLEDLFDTHVPETPPSPGYVDPAADEEDFLDGQQDD